MLSPEWLLPWWEVYGRGSGRRLCVGAWYVGARLVGLALLQSRIYRYRGVLPFRRLEFLGADVDEQDGVCSEYLNLLIEHGSEKQIAKAFVAALRAGWFGPWDEIVLGALDGSQPLSRELETEFTATNMELRKDIVTSARFITLPTSWESYLELLGRNRRVVVKSQQDFDRWAEGGTQIHRAEDSASLAEGLQILRALHGERWGAEGHGGAFQSPRFLRFHELVAPQLLARGELQLHWLTVAGAPVSCNYCIRRNGKVYFYQSGRRMQLPSRVRAGIVLHAAAIRDAINQGCREYDFLGGESQYKNQLAQESRPVLQLRLVQARVCERLRHAADRCVSLLKPLRSRISLLLSK